MTLSLREVDFLAQVTELAEIRGWEYVHFRPARTLKGWRTPVQGTLGAGWPDLLLLRERDRRVMALELKSDKGYETAEQVSVLSLLSICGISSHVIRPKDWEKVEALLK